MNFSEIFGSFADTIATNVPGIIGALIILFIGWLIAKGIKALVIRVLEHTSIDKKFSSEGNISKSIGSILYYLLMIIVFMIVLENLGISSVLSPLEEMVADFLQFIPHLVAALLIGLIGYLLAKFVSDLISFGGNFLDKIVSKTGFKDTDQIIKVVKTIVFIVIFIPLLIQAINALGLESISNPLNTILSGFIGIIGNIIIAAVILTIFVWGGKYLTQFITNLLQNLNFDNLAEKIQLKNMIGDQSFSKLIANILYFFIIYFGVITAVQILELQVLTQILDTILGVIGSIAFGLIILVIGNFVSVLIYNGMMRADANKFIASIVRYASLVIFLGMGLRAMGFANEIVNLAFGLTFGAVAVVIALSYGLGGREAAGEHFRDIIKKIKGGNKENS